MFYLRDQNTLYDYFDYLLLLGVLESLEDMKCNNLNINILLKEPVCSAV